jgi:serine/threonine protein kinase
LLIFGKLINLIWGLNFHLFLPEEPATDEFYEIYIVAKQHKWFGPFPISYKDIATEETQQLIAGIMSVVPREKLTPFRYLKEREISNADKAFLLKIMKLDPRDRPVASDLLQDQWFTERSERTVGWYSKEEWKELQQEHEVFPA